jgi:tRNA(Ile)-lysidine synthase
MDAIVDGLAAESFARDLPFGLRAFIDCGRMCLSRQPGEPVPVQPALLDIPGRADLGDAGVLVAEEALPDAIDADPLTAVVDADRIGRTLTVDAPREGDRMRPLGMVGTKKLSDVLIDAKVPREKRPGTPVVRNGEDVVWVAGVRLSEDYRVTPETRAAVRLTWLR